WSALASRRRVRTVASDHLVPRCAGGTRIERVRLRQAEPAGVEGGRPELSAELLHRRLEVSDEHVLDDADLAVVVEGHVDVLVAHEVDGGPTARRAMDGEPETA